MRAPNSAWFLAVFAGTVGAQSQPAPQADPRTGPTIVTPSTDHQQGTKLPSSGRARDQFFAPVMGIDIKGEGLSLPAGVAEPEEPVKPPAAEPKPAATAK
jgi:hypothetical protein